MMTTMRASRLVADGDLRCEDAPVPTMGDAPGHVLVRTELAAICGSDVHIVHHDLSAHDLPAPPGYPGHESVGEVVASTDPAVREGQRVLVVPPPTDARSFAEYQRLPTSQVLVVPDALPTERALMAQQLGTVLFALERFWPPGGARTVTIIGAGSAGLLFVQEVRRRGATTVVVSDHMPDRRERAAQFGADAIIDPRERSVADATMQATDGHGADLVIEAAGYDDARIDAVAAVAICGTIGFFGLPERPGISPFPFEQLFRKRATAHLEHAAQEEPGLRSFRAALARIERAESDVAGFFTHRFPIDRIAEALALATDRRDAAIKIGIDLT